VAGRPCCDWAAGARFHEARSGVVSAPGSGRRALGVVCGALVVAAGLLWGASALTGAKAGQASAVAGSATPPALTGVALLTLAGIAAVVATSGMARRVVGGLLGVAGAVVVVPTAAALMAAPAAVAAGPLLAVGGGLLLAAVGGVVIVREPRLARLGARYAAAGARPAHADPDGAAWAALDEGHDPTADPTAPTFDPATDTGPDASVKPDDPGGGRRGGAV